jgi:hypothetical protein
MCSMIVSDCRIILQEKERRKERLSEKDKKRAENYCVHIVKDMYYDDGIIHLIRTIYIVVLSCNIFLAFNILYLSKNEIVEGETSDEDYRSAPLIHYHSHHYRRYLLLH